MPPNANPSLAKRALMTGLLDGAYHSMNQASYDLARLGATASSPESPGKNRYHLTCSTSVCNH